MEKGTAISLLSIISLVCTFIPVLILGTNFGGVINGDWREGYLLDLEKGMVALLFCFVTIILNGTIFFISRNMKPSSKE